MPFLQDPGRVLEPEPLGEEQHLQVEEQVRGLAQELLAVQRAGLDLVVLGADHDLAGLLHHLLADAVHAPGEELLGVAALQGGAGLPLAQDALQALQPRLGQRLALEAGVGARVAGGPLGLGDEQQGVAVAVEADLHEPQRVPAGPALGPQRLPGAAPEGHEAALQGLLQGCAAEVAQHPHLAARGLHDPRHQALVVELHAIDVEHALTCAQRCRCRRDRPSA